MTHRSLKFLPLFWGGGSSAWHLVTRALLEILMSKGQALGTRDRLEIVWGLLSVAGPADRGKALRIVGILALRAQGKGRAMVEDEKPENEPCAAIRAVPVLAQHDWAFRRWGSQRRGLRSNGLLDCMLWLLQAGWRPGWDRRY